MKVQQKRRPLNENRGAWKVAHTLYSLNELTVSNEQHLAQKSTTTHPVLREKSHIKRQFKL